MQEEVDEEVTFAWVTRAPKPARRAARRTPRILLPFMFVFKGDTEAIEICISCSEGEEKRGRKIRM